MYTVLRKEFSGVLFLHWIEFSFYSIFRVPYACSHSHTKEWES